MVRKVRNIIKIDEEKCTGCGKCVITCEEGAIEIIDGKAKVVKESYCDGLGACIGVCPEGALSIEQREAEEFDEEAVKQHLKSKTDISDIQTKQVNKTETLPCGCPSSLTISINTTQNDSNMDSRTMNSQLQNWPIQLKLISPLAPYFKDADLLIAADCVPFSFADFHQRFLKNKILIMFCPKLDPYIDEYLEKLESIFGNNIRSITLIHMEVPCCSGIERIVMDALKKTKKYITIKDYTISIDGKII
ncbi:MAG: ATP-binding protein [Candidatus Helarchaeota archaeon]